eukprot:XP_020401123.1 glutamyl-tRNA(Gln) amidotransferase subunit A, chloroplastic/mitochondrial-like [Zea mays]
MARAAGDLAAEAAGGERDGDSGAGGSHSHLGAGGGGGGGGERGMEGGEIKAAAVGTVGGGDGCEGGRLGGCSSELVSLDLLESKPLNGLRIGIIQETPGEGVANGVVSSIKGAASHLEHLGSVVEEVSLPFIFSWLITSILHTSLMPSSEASSNLSHYDGIRYGRQVSADDLNELSGESRANGLGHESTYILSYS